MTVFVILKDYDMEGKQIEAIYSSRGKALKHFPEPKLTAKLNSRWDVWDSCYVDGHQYSIESWEVK